MNEIHARMAVLSKFTELSHPHAQSTSKFGSPTETQPFKPLFNKAVFFAKTCSAKHKSTDIPTIIANVTFFVLNIL